jgi:hypothetical protein
MTRRAKFLLACFIGAVLLWLSMIGGLIAATVAVVTHNPPIDVTNWMAGIWMGGGLIVLVTGGLVAGIGAAVWDEL